ncbi:MAG: hypothetical protein IJM88_02805 [Bacteroidales bacterium]|nr:hypothetical protein [Bacteroidales bacterium]
MKSPVVRGLLIGLGSEAAVALLLWVVLRVAGLPIAAHLSWFGACLVPPLLMVRHYVKREGRSPLVKTLITILFVTTILYIYLLLQHQAINY